MKKAVETWIEGGWFRKVKARDEARKMREFITVGRPAAAMSEEMLAGIAMRGSEDHAGEDMPRGEEADLRTLAAQGVAKVSQVSRPQPCNSYCDTPLHPFRGGGVACVTVAGGAAAKGGVADVPRCRSVVVMNRVPCGPL